MPVSMSTHLNAASPVGSGRNGSPGPCAIPSAPTRGSMRCRSDGCTPCGATPERLRWHGGRGHQPLRNAGCGRPCFGRRHGKKPVNRKRGALAKLCLLLLTASACGEVGHAMDREQLRAKTMLETMCGRCHAVGTAGPSPHVNAPPFRILGENKLYDNDFRQRLQDGLTTTHRDMPTFRFGRRDANAAVNYLRSVQDRRQPGP